MVTAAGVFAQWRAVTYVPLNMISAWKCCVCAPGIVASTERELHASLKACFKDSFCRLDRH